jgi:hypothetical protein
MNPSTLHFSKRWGLVQLAVMVGAGALILWLLTETRLFPEPTRQVIQYDFTAQGGPVLFTPPRHESAIDRLTGGWFKALTLLACIPLTLWEIVRISWRLLTVTPALALTNGHLAPHATFFGAPEKIPIISIQRVTFDRSDRVRPNFAVSIAKLLSWPGYLGAKAGARLRHTLLIDYVSEHGDLASFRITDAEVDGGVEQMQRFITYLKMIC